MHDNDPKYKSRVATSKADQLGITRVPQPAQSPDLNPQENVWSHMLLQLANRHFRTAAGFKRAIRKEWKKLSPDRAHHLADSMPERLRLVISSKGAAINY